jgi:hypothetical protein
VRRLIWVLLCITAVAQSDPRIPPEVRYKSGYVNPVSKPADFTSAMLWGIAIADTRVPDHQKAQVEISHTKLTCRIDGKDVVLNDDKGTVRGGLYQRYPWFGTDRHDPIPVEFSDTPPTRRKAEKWGIPQKEMMGSVILRVGSKPDVIWHFWAASSRAAIPAGHLEGCTVKVRARISRGALLQVGFDYWRNPTIGYESGG